MNHTRRSMMANSQNRKIIDFIRENGEANAKQISAALDIEQRKVDKSIGSMVARCQLIPIKVSGIKGVRKKYKLNPESDIPIDSKMAQELAEKASDLIKSLDVEEAISNNQDVNILSAWFNSNTLQA